MLQALERLNKCRRTLFRRSSVNMPRTNSCCPRANRGVQRIARRLGPFACLLGEAHRVLALGEPQPKRHDCRWPVPALTLGILAALGLVGEAVEQANDGLIGLAQRETAITLGF